MTTTAYVRAAFEALPSSSRRRLKLQVVMLGVISVLDLFALVLVLAVTALAGRAYARPDTDVLSTLPGPLSTLLELVGLQTLSAVLGALGTAVVLLFVAKSVLASAVLRRALLYLALQEAQLTHTLMARLMKAPLTFHLQLRNVDVMTDVTRGTAALVTNAVAPALLMAAELLLMMMIGVGLLALAPAVAIAALLYFAVTFLLLNRWIAGRARAAGKADADSTRRALTIVQWSLGGYREVIVRGVADVFVEELGTVTRHGAANRAEVNYLAVMPRYFLESALVVGLALTFVLQLPFVGPAGALSGLALFTVAGFRLLPSLNRLQAASAAISSARPFGERALDLLRSVPPATLAPQNTTPPRDPQPAEVRSGLSLRDVSFTYPGSNRPALDNVSLDVPAGRMTALVGASGSGKSTLVDVLLGLLPPDTGEVVVDGVAIASLRSEWLKSVGYVPQQVFLMPATIRENVALSVSNRSVDDEAVWEALRRASLEDVVAALPGGLSFSLGDAGAGLSGGQRQRLGIARALYARPSVLFLDEATSALDVETEAEVSRTLGQLDGLTKVVVAHRLSTVVDSDQVVFMQAGRIVTRGTFDDVSNRVPDFARQVELSGLGSAQ